MNGDKTNILRCLDLGRRDYDSCLHLQKRLVDELLAADGEGGWLLLVEHLPPVITIGATGKDGHVLAGRDELDRDGVQVRKTNRGGKVTWHGPGQLVGYPIIPLAPRGKDIRQYMRLLEEVLIRLLDGFGIVAGRREGFTGVWTGGAKIASIGVSARRWITYHGFALNVSNDPQVFADIVPCGMADVEMTSISKLLGRSVEMKSVKAPLLEIFTEVFGFDGIDRKQQSRLAESDEPPPARMADQKV